jgi:aryl-alcohol dehydrogenase-like predicted oxidoreductase
VIYSSLCYACHNANIPKWDTANIYSNGDSERVIGQAIKEYNLPRDKLVLMTKAWGVLGEEQFAAYPIMDQLRTSKDYVNQFGMPPPLSAEGIFERAGS